MNLPEDSIVTIPKQPSRILMPDNYYVPPPPPGLMTTPSGDNSVPNDLTKALTSEVRSGYPIAPDVSDPKYKMGIGGRIMGMVGNFLSGMSGLGPVAYTGSGALNNQYYQDHNKWQQGLEDAQTQANSNRQLSETFRQSQNLFSSPPAPRKEPPEEASPSRYPFDPANPAPPAPHMVPLTRRVGDTVSFQGRPHVVRAVNGDGSLHIVPMRNENQNL